MATALEIFVNDKRHRVQATPNIPLLYVLRKEVNLSSSRFGCGPAQCGVCTVHLYGAAIRSYVMPVSVVAASKSRRLKA